MTAYNGPRLEPEHDVVQAAGRPVGKAHLVATSDDPWLRMIVPADRLAGRFVEITYRASLWDEPARPVFRFTRRDGGFVERIAAGPVAGAGLWIGRVPDNTRSISVSPTNRPGPFGFAIERVRTRAWLSLLADGFRVNRRSTRSAILTRLIGWTPESDVNLAWATGATPFSAYRDWHARRARPIELDGLDRPRFDWAAGPIGLHIVADGTDAEALARTRASLEAQVFPYWTILDAGTPPAGGVTGVLRAGDALPPYALAYVAEQAWRAPDRHLFYGDAIHRQSDGTPTPEFAPGWSPRLFAAAPALPGPVFARDTLGWPDDARRHFLATGEMPAIIAARFAADMVVPLRRVIVERPFRIDASRASGLHRADVLPPPCGEGLGVGVTVPFTPAERHGTTPTPDPSPQGGGGSATIVIPTRDHPALLERAIASIRRQSPGGRYEIVVIDNGSVEPATKAHLATLRAQDDIRILEHPGPFNFSRISNEGAAVARGDVLVFLNDDTEVLSDGWLERLIGQAMDPATGAVGVRLTYPDGRLQHVGVLVGMGESAGHFGALSPGDDPGWAGRNRVVHEVSAVTGACLAVAREKFAAVGGFDAEHLPIELSDIDLCLKLNARGWQAIVDPAVHILHHESVSRGGATLRRLDVYGGQRAVFVARWRHVLRDDATFHPGLSLYSWAPALG